MRIFIALLFEDGIKDAIYDYLEEVEEVSESGNFSSYDNLHLTLLYLGETSSAMLVKITDKLREIVFRQFDYQTQGIGSFHKSQNRRIVYLGVGKSYNLESLYNLVVLKLKEIGLEFPTEKYTPHITLGRQVGLIAEHDLDQIRTRPLTIKADRISIMESTRVDGELTYRELSSIPMHT